MLSHIRSSIAHVSRHDVAIVDRALRVVGNLPREFLITLIVCFYCSKSPPTREMIKELWWLQSVTGCMINQAQVPLHLSGLSRMLISSCLLFNVGRG